MHKCYLKWGISCLLERMVYWKHNWTIIMHMKGKKLKLSPNSKYLFVLLKLTNVYVWMVARLQSLVMVFLIFWQIQALVLNRHCGLQSHWSPKPLHLPESLSNERSVFWEHLTDYSDMNSGIVRLTSFCSSAQGPTFLQKQGLKLDNPQV